MLRSCKSRWAGKGAKTFLLVLGTAGCSAEQPIAKCLGEQPEVVLPLAYQTDFIDIHAESEHPICAGTRQRFDRQVEEITAMFQEDGLARPITMVYSRRSVADWCEQPSAGCVSLDTGFAVSNYRVLTHEVAHAAACQFRAGSALPLEEGLAEGYEWPTGIVPSELTLDPGLSRDVGTREDWRALVSWLRFEYGDEAFGEVYRRSGRRMEGAEVEEVMLDAYGKTLGELVEEQVGITAWPGDELCEGAEPWEEESEGVFRREMAFDCENDPLTYGPHPNEEPSEWAGNTMYRRYLVEIEKEGVYYVTLKNPSEEIFEPLHVIARPCIEAPYEGSNVEELDGGRYAEPGVNNGPASWPLFLREGRYEVEVVMHGMEYVEHEVTIAWEEPLDEWP